MRVNRNRRGRRSPDFLGPDYPLLAPEPQVPRRRRLRPGLVYRFRPAPFVASADVPNTPLRPWVILRRVRLRAGLVVRPRIGSTLVYAIAPPELDPFGATDDTDSLVDFRAGTSRVKGN